MALTRKRALWLDTESSFGADPSANGSGYAAVPAFTLGDITDEKQVIETNYVTGRQYPTIGIPGQDGGSFDFTVPLIGLSAAAGDGTNASTVADDWLDQILTHIFGNQDTTAGEGIATIPDANGFTVDAGDPYDAQDLVPIWEAGIPAAGARTQWVLVTADNGTQDYDSAPALDGSTSNAALALGAKIYRLTDAGGATLSFVYQDDDVGTYVLSGCRITACTITGEVNGRWEMACTVSFDRIEEDASGKTNLPDALAAPANTPVIVSLSPVWFGGTAYATRRVQIDLGITASPVMATEGANSRSDWTNIGHAPTVQIEPLRTDAIRGLKRNVTEGRLMVQLGGGVLSGTIGSGGKINSLCFHVEAAHASEVAMSDDEGRARQSVTFMAHDKVYFASGVTAQMMQLARC